MKLEVPIAKEGKLLVDAEVRVVIYKIIVAIRNSLIKFNVASFFPSRRWERICIDIIHFLIFS